MSNSEKASTQRVRGGRPWRVAIVVSHPIQYFAPLFRELASRPSIELEVIYGSRRGLDSYVDPGFGGEEISWDMDLLGGYSSTFLRDDITEVGTRGDLRSVRIINALKDHRPDAVIVHGYASTDVLSALAVSKALGSCTLMRADSNSKKERSSLRSLIRRPLIRAIFRMVDAGLAIGTRNATYYRQCGLKESQIFEAPFSVDTEYFGNGQFEEEINRRSFLQSHGLEPDRITILFASKMVPWKRPADIIDAIEKLSPRLRRQLQVVMVGDGPLRRHLEEKSRAVSMPFVFPGFINQSKLPSWYAASDLFVLPSSREAWGLVINEAMAAGTPVVATRQAGATIDLVDYGETGFVYDAGDVGSLSGIFAAVARQPQRLQKMSRRVEQKISNWTLSATADGYLHAINTLCGAR